MSRAFIKEDAGDDEPPERPIPSGPNYVTPRGLDLIRAALAAAVEKRDRRYWQARLGAAVVVDNARCPPDDIRFGASVELKDAAGRVRRLRIVGQDEAAEGGVLAAWDSIPARVLTGRRAGERVMLEDGEWEVVSFGYGGAA